MPHTDKRASLHKTRGQELSKRQAAPVALSASPHCSAPRRSAHFKDPRTRFVRRQPVASQPHGSIHSAAATPPRLRANRAPGPPASPRPGPAPRLPPRREPGSPRPAHPCPPPACRSPSSTATSAVTTLPPGFGKRREPRPGTGLGAAPLCPPPRAALPNSWHGVTARRWSLTCGWL